MFGRAGLPQPHGVPGDSVFLAIASPLGCCINHQDTCFLTGIWWCGTSREGLWLWCFFGNISGFLLGPMQCWSWWHEDQGMWRKEVRAHFWEGVQWCRVPSILPSYRLHFSEAKHHVWSNGWSRIQLGWDHLGFTCPGIPPGWGGCSRELCCSNKLSASPQPACVAGRARTATFVMFPLHCISNA